MPLKPENPSSAEELKQHLLKARKLAENLKMPRVAHFISMAVLDIYGDELEDDEEGESPISPN